VSYHECSRCGAQFAVDADHTEIVRRDFRGEPQPPTIEHLCGDCLRAYREEFLGTEGVDATATGHEQDAES
jgi:hypothetical protein